MLPSYDIVDGAGVPREAEPRDGGGDCDINGHPRDMTEGGSRDTGLALLAFDSRDLDPRSLPGSVGSASSASSADSSKDT